MPEQNLEECLEYFGCDEKEKVEIMKCSENCSNEWLEAVSDEDYSSIKE